MRPHIYGLASLGAFMLFNLVAATHVHAERTEQCVYERDPVKVAGEVHRKRRKADTVVVLKLRRSLCVMLPDDVNMTPRPRHIHELQLLSNDKLPRSSDKLHHVEGNVMLADGTHHQLPVLLEVQQIKESSKQARRHR